MIKPMVHDNIELCCLKHKITLVKDKNPMLSKLNAMKCSFQWHHQGGELQGVGWDIIDFQYTIYQQHFTYDRYMHKWHLKLADES